MWLAVLGKPTRVTGGKGDKFVDLARVTDDTGKNFVDLAHWR